MIGLPIEMRDHHSPLSEQMSLCESHSIYLCALIVSLRAMKSHMNAEGSYVGSQKKNDKLRRSSDLIAFFAAEHGSMETFISMKRYP